LRSGRNTNPILISLWMDVLGNRSVLLIGTSSTTTPQKGKTGLDVSIRRIELGSPGICIESIRSLIVARFIL
jgi:hypothetical protein